MNTARRTPYAILLQFAAMGHEATDDEINALVIPPGQSADRFRSVARDTLQDVRTLRAAGANGAARSEARLAASEYASAFDPGRLPQDDLARPEVDESDPAALARAALEHAQPAAVATAIDAAVRDQRWMR